MSWKAELKNEMSVLDGIQTKITTVVQDYLESVTSICKFQDTYQQLVDNIRSQTSVLEIILGAYNRRIVHLATHYDKATKTSTLVNENYDKIEECVDITRTELRDILKKMYSFTTLEMDYYDKLLSVWDGGVCSGPMATVFHQDYEQYRHRLEQSHRYDQIRFFATNVGTAIHTAIHIIAKLYSILDNDSNLEQVQKLWEENSFHY